jgi:hypothetical protein
MLRRLLLAALVAFASLEARPALAAPPSRFLPPPPPPAVRVAPPSPVHVWIDGRWMWTGAGWAWQPGAWIVPAPRPVVTTWGPPRPIVVARPVVVARPMYVVPARPVRPVIVVRRGR